MAAVVGQFMSAEVARRPAFEVCPLCGTPIDTAAVSQAVEDRDGDQVEFCACATCHTLFPNSVVQDVTASDAAETQRQADYHAGLWEDDNFEQLDLLAAGAMPLAWEFAEFLGDPGESAPDGRRRVVADIGAGRGNIIHAVQRLGFPVVGCEPSPALCRTAEAAYLLGDNIIKNCDAETYLAGPRAGREPIRAFIIWHVLEHIRQPIAVLEACLRLAPESLLFIELPLAITDDIFDEHLFFPTPVTLRWLADRYDLAIELLQITEDDRLRVFYRAGVAPEDRVEPSRPLVQPLDQLDAMYRTISPAFAHFSPADEPVEEVSGANA